MFHIGTDGLVRTETLDAFPESSNFLFVKTSGKDRFISYSDDALLDRYLGMPSSAPRRRRNQKR